jgi:aldehyde dehydrogenase
MMAAMERAGAVRLNAPEVDRLTQAALQRVGEGADAHWAPRKELLGQDAWKLAEAAGRKIDPRVELVFGETTSEHPFVQTEQMMPFVPFVRCPNFETAVELAQQAEHGYRHTSIIHSRNVRNMTIMGRTMDTTLFVKNGPCMAALGLGGEGYLSFSIAGPTGEGVTTPLTFTRERRCSLIDDLFILGR